jgi:hypothetical protein
MAKYTTTLFEYIQSELQRKGHNEFFDKTSNLQKDMNLTFYEDDYAFIKKVMLYDDDVKPIVEYLFRGESLSDQTLNDEFKKAFANRFLNRQIGRQTIEDFSSQLAFTFNTLKRSLEVYYENYKDFMTGGQTTERTLTGSKDTTGMNNSTTQDREAFSSLPQNDINIDITNNVLQYADTNDVGFHKTSADSKQDETNQEKEVTQLNKFDIEQFLLNNTVLLDIFDIIDKKCFLQVW